MNKKFYALLPFIYFIASCCNTKIETTYIHGNTTIIRVDECGKTTFYYNKRTKDAPKIWAEYSGISGDFSGYLKFEDDGKVSLLSGNGYFQSSNNDTSKFNFKRIIVYERPDLEQMFTLFNSQPDMKKKET